MLEKINNNGNKLAKALTKAAEVITIALALIGALAELIDTVKKD